MNNNECPEHVGESKKLFCNEPCKMSLCAKCVKNHNKHDIRSLTDITDEMIVQMEDSKYGRFKQINLCKNQIEAIEEFKDQVKGLLIKYKNEESEMEKIVTEPLQEIINEFKEKVESFINMMNEKKEFCESFRSNISGKVDAISSKIEHIKILGKEGNYEEVYNQWISNSYLQNFDDLEDENQCIIDMDFIKDYVNALKNLNVSEKLKILVQSFLDVLEKDKVEPILMLIDTTTEKISEVKKLFIDTDKIKKEIKEIIIDAEKGKKDIKNAVISAMGLLDKKDFEKAENLIDENEETLKTTRDKLISEIKKTNITYTELSKRRKEMEDSFILNAKIIAEWKKQLQECERINIELKKECNRFSSLMDDYGKEVIKCNQQYTLRLKEFDEFDNKLQAMRNNLIKNEELNASSIKKNYPLRLSIISIGKNQSLPLELINVFISDSSIKDFDEPFTGTKDYNISIKFESYKADFYIWYLGLLENVKSADSNYYQNVEYILLMYNLEEKEEDMLDNVKETIEFLKGKTEALFALTGIYKDKPLENKEILSNYAKSFGIPLKLINLKDKEEIKQLFYSMFYAKHPELYKES